MKRRTIIDFIEASSTSFILNIGLEAGTKVEAVTISFVQPLANDVQQQIDSILQQYGFNTVRINEMNVEVSKKADKTYVDSLGASLASGSPKGIYATVTALQTAKPTGDSNIYVVTADGKWYFWSGSAWTAGGVYQSIALADQSVTTSKLKDGATTLNKTTVDIFPRNLDDWAVVTYTLTVGQVASFNKATYKRDGVNAQARFLYID
ncbi:hypothetical protein OVA29_08815 [Exiguobacterium sp. SL14]|nr:hypothetical protein [Exiguobacterium sp. SL14]MCY1690755.1 hypothetical protein [Exiguobacterium sp. SL14]